MSKAALYNQPKTDRQPERAQLTTGYTVLSPYNELNNSSNVHNNMD